MSEVRGGASSRRGAAHATAPPEQDLCRSRPIHEKTYKIPPWTTRMRPQSHSPPVMSNWSGTFCTQTIMSESSWTEWSQNIISTLQDSVAAFLLSTEHRADALRAYIAEHPRSAFQNSPWALVAAIEDFATTRSHIMIFRESKVKIARAALEAMPVKPKVILDFGTYVGNSALAWGAILQSLHGEDAAAQGCRVYTFEIDPGMVRVAREFIQLAGLDDLVHVLEGPAADSLQRLYEEGKIARGGVDMVFFDHWEKYYLPDLLLCENLRVLREGSLVIADNTDVPGAPQFLKHVRSGGGGGLGMVRYESRAFESTTDIGVPNLVEISTVVET